MKKKNSILAANHSSEILAELYRRKKRCDALATMSAACAAIQYSSKGNLSQVLKGKRSLPKKFRGPLLDWLEATPLEKNYALARMSLEEQDLSENAQHLEHLEKSLDVLHTEVPRDILSMPCGFELICVFGLFDRAVSEEELQSYFRDSGDVSIKEALAALVSAGIVLAENDLYRLEHPNIMLDIGDLSKRIAFVRRGLHHANDELDSQFDDDQHTFFTSNLISVDLQRYKELLQDIRLSTEVMCSRLESDKADSIIRFNLQIFPMRRCASE